MNHTVCKAVRQARRNNELHFLERKIDILREEEEARKAELEAENALAELLGYSTEPVVSNK